MPIMQSRCCRPPPTSCPRAEATRPASRCLRSRLIWLVGQQAAIRSASPRASWLLSVTESSALPPQPCEGGRMSKSDKFDIREWLVPPLLVPVFLALLIVVVALL